MGNICSSDADVNILHTPYIGKDVSKYSGPEQYRVMTDAQRSTHSSSPERRRAPVRDGPAVILEHQEVQQEQQEQPWGHSPRPVLLEQQVAEQEQADEVLEDAGPVQFNWTMGKLIGSGAFGSVFSALNTDTGEMVAVKQVSFAKDKALQGRVAEHIKALEAEVEVLKTLQHENIVRYLGTERTEDALHIFLEYVPEGSIASMLAKFGALPESVIRLYTAQLLRGLEYLHQKGIMHRDIKGANILIASNGTVKLADFGASKKIEDLATIGSGSKSIRGTPYWMAPEVIKQTGHGCPADIWSLGCTVIEMATGKPPWSTCAGPVAAMFQIASSKDPPPLPEHLSREAKDFLLLCFNRVARDRANATRLLKHPFVANVQLQQPIPLPVASANTAGSSNSSPAATTITGSSSSASRPSGSSVAAGGTPRGGLQQHLHHQQQQQLQQLAHSTSLAARQSTALMATSRAGSMRAPAAANTQPVQTVVVKAAEQMLHGSPGQARSSPKRQQPEGPVMTNGSAAGGPAATAALGQLCQRGDASAVISAVRPIVQQQQQQPPKHVQPEQQQQQQQLLVNGLPAKQFVQETPQLLTQQLSQQQRALQPQQASQQQQRLRHSQSSSASSSVEGLPKEGCATLLDWNPVQEPSWAPVYPPALARCKSTSQQPLHNGRIQQQQQQQQQQVAAADQPELDAPRGSFSNRTPPPPPSSNGLVAVPAAVGMLRHGSGQVTGSSGSTSHSSKKPVPTSSMVGPLAQGPAGRALNSSGAASTGSAAASVALNGSAAASVALNGSVLNKGSKPLYPAIHASGASSPAQATAAAVLAQPVTAECVSTPVQGASSGVVAGQDQWNGMTVSALQPDHQAEDVVLRSKQAQWENELYAELAWHRQEQRASRAAAAARMSATPQKQ